MRLSISLILCIVGAIFFCIPNMTRREVLFGLALPPGFRATGPARQSICFFRALLFFTTLLAVCCALFAAEPLLPAVAIAGPLALLFTAGAAFFCQHRRLAPFAIDSIAPRQVELTSTPERLPWFISLAVGPFLILALFWRYSDPHMRNRLTLFAAELCSWIFLLGIASWYGARRSRLRRLVLALTIATNYFVALLFTAIETRFVDRVPPWLILMGPLLFLAPMLILLARAVAQPGQSIEPTPNECWKGGILYYNPNDAALFVEKRDGLGYTFNFGNKWSWLLILGFALVLSTAPLLL